ncbi:hypothetical protein V8D89_004732 [Ganoderma adspersum]
MEMQLKITKCLIAQGVFGKVFEGELVDMNDEPGRVVAVKVCHISNKVRHPLLLHEACALSILKGHRSIPAVFAWGRSQFFEYMALQRLGTTLQEAFQGDERKPLSLRNMVVLVCQMIDAVQHVHSKGIVHRDIKPDNFILGLPGTELAGRLYLIDFGLCKPYRHLDTGEHLPCKRTRRRVACRTFSTVYDNYHETLSRRDDIIALVYTMMALLTGPLPWVWVHHDDLPEERADYYPEGGLDGDELADESDKDVLSENEPTEDEEKASHDGGHDDPFSQNDTSQTDDAEDEPAEDSDGSIGSSRSVLSWVSWSDRWSTADFVNCKLAWSDGTLLAEGYPAVFGEFYTYALRLGYSTTPEYDSWKAQFRDAMMPGLPEDPLYDPSDTSEPLVGVSLRTVERMEVPPDQEVNWLGFSHGDPPIPICDDGWMPAGEMCWRGPYTVKEDELLGDELKIIGESHVHVLKTTPASEILFLDPGCPPERMLSLEMSRKATDKEL